MVTKHNTTMCETYVLTRMKELLVELLVDCQGP